MLSFSLYHHHCESHQTQAKEAAFVEYLKACEGGKVPAKAPVARVRPFDGDEIEKIKIEIRIVKITIGLSMLMVLQVREVFVAKEVIPLEGCGEGCANPNA